MDACVSEVQSDSIDKERARAICYASVVGEENLAQAISESKAALARAFERVTFRGRLTESKKTGSIWEVVLMGPGDGVPVEIDGQRYLASKNGRLYWIPGLRECAPMFEGVKVFDNHLTNSEFEERGGMRSVMSEAIGVLKNARIEGDELRAELRVIDSAARAKLLNAYDLDVLDDIGLSVDTDVVPGPTVIYNGRSAKTVTGFMAVFSVDLVAHPAAGGGFRRLVAAETLIHSRQGDNAMELTEEQLDYIATALAERAEREAVDTEEPGAELDAEGAAQAVADVVADVAAEPIPEDVTPEEAARAVADVARAVADDVAGDAAEGEEEGEEEEEAAADIKRRMERLECSLQLRDALDAARLPVADRRIIEAAFGGRVFTEAVLKTTIKRAKEAQAIRDPSGRARGAGGGRVVGPSDVDKKELGLMRLVMGKRAFEGLADRKEGYVAERVPESYRSWTKAGKPNYGEGFYGTRDWMRALFGFMPRIGDHRTYEAMSTSSLSTAVKNTVNIVLANDYARREEWWLPIVEEHEVDTIDDMTLARVFGLDALSVVEAGGSYTEFNFADEEETASFVKNGNHLAINMETLMSDKLGVTTMQNIGKRLSATWYNTLSDYVGGVFTTNTATGPVLSDTGALFNSTAVGSTGGHANLLTTALSYTAWDAVNVAMMNQTDQPLGAGRKLAMENIAKYLLVPVGLRTTALRIRNSEKQPGTANNDDNPYYQGFEVIVVPTFTDANDWAAMADPAINPSIHLVFPTGNRVPQIFAATSETEGAMFTNDALRYKVRLMTFRVSSTYPVAPVSDWRPLHKSNV